RIDPCPQAGPRLPAVAGDRAPALLRGRAAVQGSPRRLHPRGQARPAAGRLRADGVPRARRLRTGRRGARGREHRVPRTPAPAPGARAGRSRGFVGSGLGLKLTLEDDGTDFRGWAAQPGQRTVERAVRRALPTMHAAVAARAVAGRTDTGVHALGNVASVDVTGGPPVARAAEALNTALPDDVAVVRAEEPPPGFHARFSAR